MVTALRPVKWAELWISPCFWNQAKIEWENLVNTSPLKPIDHSSSRHAPIPRKFFVHSPLTTFRNNDVTGLGVDLDILLHLRSTYVTVIEDGRTTSQEVYAILVSISKNEESKF